MRKILFITFLVLTSGTTLNAQKNAIKANVLSPAFGRFSISYERAFSENTSFQVSYFYAWSRPDFNIWGSNGIKWTGFGITPEFRLYTSENGGNGFYLAPYIRYVRFNSGEYTDDISSYDPNSNIYTPNIQTYSAIETKIGGGFMIGRQWIFADFISLDTFLGLGALSWSVEETGFTTNEPSHYNIEENRTLLDLRLGVNIGVAF